LPEGQRPLARRVGILAAVSTRILLLFSLFWLSHLENAFVVPGIPDQTFTPRQIVFGLGGAFLIVKALSEIWNLLEPGSPPVASGKVRAWGGAFAWVILQIALFDVVFSLDSVIAAIGIAKHIEVMVAAVLTATLIMFFLVNPISNFIDRRPVVKLIALNFLILVGALLIVEATKTTLPRAFFYVALAAAIVVQLFFLWLRKLPAIVRVPITLAIVAFVALLIASQLTDLTPYIGAPAVQTLNDIVQWLANALTDVVNRLTPILAMR
jgi:predicted tellurium resistance membrane protein TerC